MRARRVGAWLLLAVAFVAHAGCSKDTPTSSQVELVGTLTLTRTGDEIALGEVWLEKGTAELSVKAELSQLKDGALVGGSGTGEASLELSRGGCIEKSKWNTRYVVNGSLDTDPTCRLALQIDVTWTNGHASITCAGRTASQQEPDLTFSLLGVIFENNAHETRTTLKDGAMGWDNRFEMKRFDSTGVTRCQFNS